MFDEILNAVKQQFANHPDLSSLTQEQQDALHNEIANHVHNTVQNQAGGTPSTGAGLLSQVEGFLTSNTVLSGAVEGGLVSSLASKLGLPPSITGAISGALPGLIQKFANKNTQTTGM